MLAGRRARSRTVIATHDLVIRNGVVIDGTGRPGRRADVAVSGERIADVGDDVSAGRRELDADGRVVCPGWVDIHTHYDGQATWDPDLAPSSVNGVTSVVMGNCGVGFAPARHPRLAYRSARRSRGHPRHRAGRGPVLGLGELPRVPRHARRPALDHRRRRPGSPRRSAHLRDGRAGRRPHRPGKRGRHRGDVPARRGGGGLRGARVHHVADLGPPHVGGRADRHAHRRSRGGAWHRRGAAAPLPSPTGRGTGPAEPACPWSTSSTSRPGGPPPTWAGPTAEWWRPATWPT